MLLTLSRVSLLVKMGSAVLGRGIRRVMPICDTNFSVVPMREPDSSPAAGELPELEIIKNKEKNKNALFIYAPHRCSFEEIVRGRNLNV